MYWMTGILGLFLMFSPYIFNYANDPSATWVSLGSGFVVLVVSIWEGAEKKETRWEYWVAAIVGVFAILAPFIFGFGSITVATWTTVIVGAIIAILSGTKIWGGGTTQIT